MSYKKKINYIFRNNILDSFIINKLFSYLDKGKIKVCYRANGFWKINNWVKKLILIYIKFKEKRFISSGFFSFDKFVNKFSKKNINYFYKKNIRFTCLSFVRYGSYLGSNIVMMPCFVNVGAYVGKGTMLDTWCSIGSCARIGSNVHISGGVGIGGVLEPLNSYPVIIEDNCFIGARTEIVEGTIIKKNSVISMGVFIGKSTKIYDRINKRFYFSYIPSGSVVVSGCLNYGIFSLYSVIIVKKRDSKTDSKVKINKDLRIFND